MIGSLLLQCILISVNAVFASAEIALLSINDVKLDYRARSGDKRARRLQKLTREPARFLATIQVGITLAGFLGSAFAADNFSESLVELLRGTGIPLSPAALRTLSVIVITVILSFITLVFGELVPKRIAMKKAEALAFLLSALIYHISRIFSPLVSLLTLSTNALLRLFRLNPEEEEAGVTEEEIRLLVDAGSLRGTIDAGEKDIIHNVFEFDDKTAEEAMTHRKEVVFLRLKDTAEDWEKAVLETRYDYYPITGESSDDIVGVLDAKDYFRLRDRSRHNVLARAVRPAYLVPDSVKTDVLFRNMKKQRNHFAVVLDEYGGVSGIITMNDLLEQLVGDLDDGEHPARRKEK